MLTLQETSAPDNRRWWWTIVVVTCCVGLPFMLMVCFQTERCYWWRSCGRTWSMSRAMTMKARQGVFWTLDFDHSGFSGICVSPATTSLSICFNFHTLLLFSVPLLSLYLPLSPSRYFVLMWLPSLRRKKKMLRNHRAYLKVLKYHTEKLKVLTELPPKEERKVGGPAPSWGEIGKKNLSWIECVSYKENTENDEREMKPCWREPQMFISSPNSTIQNGHGYLNWIYPMDQSSLGMRAIQKRNDDVTFITAS